MESNHNNKLCYSVKEAASAIGLSTRTIGKLVKSGLLPVVRVGKRVLIPAEAIQSWLVAESTKSIK